MLAGRGRRGAGRRGRLEFRATLSSNRLASFSGTSLPFRGPSFSGTFLFGDTQVGPRTCGGALPRHAAPHRPCDMRQLCAHGTRQDASGRIGLKRHAAVKLMEDSRGGLQPVYGLHDQVEGVEALEFEEHDLRPRPASVAQAARVFAGFGCLL